MNIQKETVKKYAMAALTMDQGPLEVLQSARLYASLLPLLLLCDEKL
jgi:hypothetical protein